MVLQGHTEPVQRLSGKSSWYSAHHGVGSEIARWLEGNHREIIRLSLGFGPGLFGLGAFARAFVSNATAVVEASLATAE